MNREIKFRAWNHTQGSWNGMWCKDIQSCGELICLNGIYVIPESISRNHTVQQFIGLLDKNGKEIYEGDIVTYTSINGKDYKAEIVFSPALAAFVLDTSRRHLLDDKYGDYYELHKDHSYEVIGNIFENNKQSEV